MKKTFSELLDIELKKVSPFPFNSAEKQAIHSSLRNWLTQERESAEACRYEICDDCENLSKALKQMLELLAAEIPANSCEQTQKGKTNV